MCYNSFRKEVDMKRIKAASAAIVRTPRASGASCCRGQ